MVRIKKKSVYARSGTFVNVWRKAGEMTRRRSVTRMVVSLNPILLIKKKLKKSVRSPKANGMNRRAKGRLVLSAKNAVMNVPGV